MVFWPLININLISKKFVPFYIHFLGLETIKKMLNIIKWWKIHNIEYPIPHYSNWSAKVLLSYDSAIFRWKWTLLYPKLGPNYLFSHNSWFFDHILNFCESNLYGGDLAIWPEKQHVWRNAPPPLGYADSNTPKTDPTSSFKPAKILHPVYIRYEPPVLDRESSTICWIEWGWGRGKLRRGIMAGPCGAPFWVCGDYLLFAKKKIWNGGL